MYRLERENFLAYPLICLWGLLGFQAGFINSFGFLACGRYVSHVTGFGTQIGVALADGKPALALELLGFPFSFILGAAFSGFFTIARIDRNLRPRYDLVTFLLPLFLCLTAAAGSASFFGDFGRALSDPAALVLLFFLSFLCGLQNGCFATLTKGQIRTTHLTGISTDIGTDMARLVFGQLDGNERRLVWRANVSRFLTFAGFATGSIVSVAASEQLEYMALGVPVITSTVVFGTVVWIGAAMDRRLLGQELAFSRTTV